MAIVHFVMKSSSSAPPSAKHSDYITREQEYSRRKDVEWSQSGNMPDFATQSAREFWLAADAHERANGRTYTELQIALPRELSRDGQIALAQQVAREFMGHRFAYTMAVHNPVAHDKIEQPHLHLMFSERTIDDRTRKLEADQFFKRNGAKKDRDWHDRDKPEELRKAWCEMMNRAFEREQIPVRVDPRSWAEQGREDLAALVEPKLSELTFVDRPERLNQIEQLRSQRQELPSPELTGADLAQQEAKLKIEAIEQEAQKELSLLDRAIAKVKETWNRWLHGRVDDAEASLEQRLAARERERSEARAREQKQERERAGPELHQERYGPSRGGGWGR